MPDERNRRVVEPEALSRDACRRRVNRAKLHEMLHEKSRETRIRYISGIG